MQSEAPQSLLIDVGVLSCGCTDHVLDVMHKALAEDDGGIWRPHESVFLRDLVEQITQRGAGSLKGLADALEVWFGKGGGKAPAVADPRAQAIFQALAQKPVAQWSAGECSVLIDYLVRQHFPDEFVQEMALALSKQAALMGRLQAANPDLTLAQVASVASRLALPGALQHALDLANLHRDMLAFGEAQCADRIQGLTDAMRHKIKAIILDHQRTVRLEGSAGEALQTRLFDVFGEINRDWRRIALTEAGEMANQGLIASCAPGEKLERVEQYQGACAFCRKIDGAVATVVPASKPDKDWDTEIWPGKSNVGRSASPYRRIGGQLVKRAPSEMWTLPAGLVHPHCRGRWVRLGGGAKDDPLTGWLFKD